VVRRAVNLGHFKPHLSTPHNNTIFKKNQRIHLAARLVAHKMNLMQSFTGVLRFVAHLICTKSPRVCLYCNRKAYS